MKIINCPLNGPTNAQEFICGGEVCTPPHGSAGRAAWADYVFLENNHAGVVREWWCHLPSSYWFIAERDTTTDVMLKAYPVSGLEQAKAGPDDS